MYKKKRHPWYFEAYHYEAGDPIASFKEAIADQWVVPLPEMVAERLFEDPAMQSWFRESQKIKSSVVSEDCSFCHKARRYGFKSYADIDLSYEVLHIGSRSFGIQRPDAASAEAYRKKFVRA